MVDHIAAPPGPKALEAAAKHVAHDVTMLGQAYAAHRDVFAWTAWYVFCRSVMDFFDPNRPHADDILAEHYFERPETWSTVLTGIPRPLRYSDFRIATNKLAAHLTYARVRYEGDSTWSPSLEVTRYLLDLAECFLEHLPDERRAWFEKAEIQCAIPKASPLFDPDPSSDGRADSSIAEDSAEPPDLSDEDLIDRLANVLISKVPALRSLAELADASGVAGGPGAAPSFDLDELVSAEELERAYVIHVLAETGGNKSRTAEVLGVDQSTLYRKLNRWGVK